MVTNEQRANEIVAAYRASKSAQRPLDVEQVVMDLGFFIKVALDEAEKRGAVEAIDTILRGIDREQNYREHREDQDGSGIAACKEIRGYVKAVLNSKVALTAKEPK